MPEQQCAFCNKELPAIRHPKQGHCSNVCWQRDRYRRSHVKNGIKCLICGKEYVRIGSHVVNSHGYESSDEYRWDYGLMARETRTDTYAKKMSNKACTFDNLKAGAPDRFVAGGDHGEYLKKFWNNRKNKRPLGKR